VTTIEPEWDADQVGYLIASMEREAEIGPHGIPMSVATNKEIAHKVKVDLHVDHVARAIEQTRESYRTEFGHQDQAGWRFTAHIDD